jgi:hypothetical protein
MRAIDVVTAIDQDPARAGSAHCGKRDLLLAGGLGVQKEGGLPWVVGRERKKRGLNPSAVRSPAGAAEAQRAVRLLLLFCARPLGRSSVA